jgi:hypothetical protein
MVSLIVILFVPISLPAQTIGLCTGPERDFISFVAEKQEEPPMLELNPGTSSGKPCKSPVAESVAQKPSWQVLKTNKAVKIALDKDGTIVTLEIVPKSFTPKKK